MKKVLALGLVALVAACNNTVKVENNTDNLILVKSEPRNCDYLYKIDVDASFYTHNDAIQYLKNRIMFENSLANVFWLEKDEKQQNDWVMFGPEYKYIMTARVYNCRVKK